MAAGAVVGAVERAFVAHHHGHALAIVGEPLEGECEAVVEGFQVGVASHFLAAVEQVVVEYAGFDVEQSAEAPAGGDHGGDEFELDGVLGLELLDVAVGEELVVLHGFAGDDDVLGEQAVAARVEGGSGLAGAGDRSSGFRGVGAVGVELGLRGFVGHGSSRGG